MGYGDEIMATGIAKKLYEKENRVVSFPTKTKEFEEIVLNNPKIGDGPNTVSCNFTKGNRWYIKLKDNKNKRLLWNYKYKPIPGEIYFLDSELKKPKKDYILVEPHTKQTVSADNKQWPIEYMQEVVNKLSKDFLIVQLDYGKTILNNVVPIRTKTFREGTAILKYAKKFLGMEGGMHHAAAALKVPGIVIYGGYIPPDITGYDIHTNIYKGGEACGKLSSCKHCKESLLKITPEEVVENFYRI
ncbi:MAG TPA: glycosyltransferase family 9 protein [Thermodesulfobacteriota bacterium]|nr:glycosyltransferase family 9 protein [Thermodesulfobacteriota bacterium]